MTQTQTPQIYTGHSVPYSSPGIISPNVITPGSANSYFPNDDQNPYGGQSYRSRPPSFSVDRATDRFGAPYSNGYGAGEGYGSRVNGSHQVPPPGAIRSARSSQDLGPRRPEVAGAHVAKNLIGSASSSAFRLTDENGKVGLWFILQDLSVRTEGTFRLKLSFFNLSSFNLSENENKISGKGPELMNEAPCLASVFSKVFRVWSAKKFPGVIETTSLSRRFAKQGIKIPIRKDGNSRKRKGAGSDDDDQDLGSDDDGF